MLIKSQSEVHLHTGRSVHFHPSRCASPSFSIFRGSGSETTSSKPYLKQLYMPNGKQAHSFSPVVNQLCMAKMLEHFKQGCQQEYIACQ